VNGCCALVLVVGGDANNGGIWGGMGDIVDKLREVCNPFELMIVKAWLYIISGAISCIDCAFVYI